MFLEDVFKCLYVIPVSSQGGLPAHLIGQYWDSPIPSGKHPFRVGIGVQSTSISESHAGIGVTAAWHSQEPPNVVATNRNHPNPAVRCRGNPRASARGGCQQGNHFTQQEVLEIDPPLADCPHCGDEHEWSPDQGMGGAFGQGWVSCPEYGEIPVGDPRGE